ncbi:hypothetical protein ACF1GT_24240 [Streptomyces sp. NPDC014636]|uniref:hypothetical protein n=1 Tax=Streptomyces sp. NPDC014636 TaxID=3364876 RepID=UPI0036F580B3
MERGSGPSTGRQVGVSLALAVIDLMVIAWLMFGYGMQTWADSYDSGNPPSAPEVALHGMWLLACGAVVTGGGLLALRRRIAGIVQLVVLGAGAGLLAISAAGR